MNELVTVDSILGYLKETVEQRQIIPPSKWADAAQKLNVLLGDEHDKLYDLQHQVANIKLAHLDEDPKRNVSAAKTKVEATDEYRELRKQEAKCKRIEEFIRISKVQARLREAEYRSGV